MTVPDCVGGGGKANFHFPPALCRVMVMKFLWWINSFSVSSMILMAGGSLINIMASFKVMSGYLLCANRISPHRREQCREQESGVICG